MPVLKVYKSGAWEEIGGTSPMNGGNADTLDGKHAAQFVDIVTMEAFEINLENILSTMYSGLTDLSLKVGDEPVPDQIDNKLANFSSGKTLSEHLTEEDMVLSSRQYGDKLPGEDGEPYTHVPGRIFFLSK